MPTLDNLRIAVIATGRVEEPELAEPVRALREAGARTELLSIKPGQIQAGKPMAGICHAPWGLGPSGLAHGRTLTSYHTLQDDLRHAGAAWVDREVVVHGNLVTSRQPGDSPAFTREMLDLSAAARGA